MSASVAGLLSLSAGAENHSKREDTLLIELNPVRCLASSNLRATRSADWTLTAEAFEKLLKHIDIDPDRAAEKYVVLYSKLIRFFEWRRCAQPESNADETINRVIRKIEQGAVVTNVQGYLYGIAKRVSVEALREENKKHQALADLTLIGLEQPDEAVTDARLNYVDAFLSELDQNNRQLLLTYYAWSDSKWKHRKELAERQGISVNALRVKVHRLRVALERFVTDCLNDRQTVGANLSPCRLSAVQSRISPLDQASRANAVAATRTRVAA